MEEQNSQKFLEQICELQTKIDQICVQLKAQLGIESNQEKAEDVKTTDENTFEVDLLEEIEGLTCFESILETLNQEGYSRGYSFKKGQRKQSKGEDPTSKTIICKLYNRGPHAGFEAIESKKKFDKKPSPKYTNCKAFYRFRVQDPTTVSLTTYQQTHNHGPYFSAKSELTEAMKTEISKFSKDDKISHVKERLEFSFKCKIDYWVLYAEFRRQFPRFDPDDCKKFLAFLDKNNADHREEVISKEKVLCKLLFQTPLMRKNYIKFGEVLLLDATYNTNFYSIPLVILSGVNNEYKNLIFGIALVNDESKQTYSWLLNNFFQMNNNKRPTLLISDNDSALAPAMSEEFPEIKHRFCAWHISRSFRRNFRFLKAKDQEIKDQITSLPYLTDKEAFKESELKITKFLKENNYTNSLDYINKYLEVKSQWSIANYPPLFDCGISTTSRAESNNAHIKRYINSKSYISDIIKFIQRSETVEFDSNNNLNPEKLKPLEFDPLITALKDRLPIKLLYKEIGEYYMAKQFENRVKNQSLNCIDYEVYHQNIKRDPNLNPEDLHIVKFDKKIQCDCNYFIRIGLICRHVFHICYINNIKSLDRLIISDRWYKSLEVNGEVSFLESEVQNIVNLEANHYEDHKEEDKAELPATVEDLSHVDSSLDYTLEEEKIEPEYAAHNRPQMKRNGNNSESPANNVSSLSPTNKKKVEVKNFEKKTNTKGARKWKKKRKNAYGCTARDIQRLEEELKKIKLNFQNLQTKENKQDQQTIRMPKKF